MFPDRILDDKYLNKLADLILFYWEFRLDNPNIQLAQAWMETLMKKYKYVVVSGCSFSSSDNPNLVNPGETYGDLIAEHLGAKFYNLSICNKFFSK